MINSLFINLDYSFHQANLPVRRHPDYCGVQCSAMAVQAILHHARFPCHKWNRYELHRVLACGHDLYCDAKKFVADPWVHYLTVNEAVRRKSNFQSQPVLAIS